VATFPVGHPFLKYWCLLVAQSACLLHKPDVDIGAGADVLQVISPLPGANPVG
jgi:hypothetical protein